MFNLFTEDQEDNHSYWVIFSGGPANGRMLILPEIVDHYVFSVLELESLFDVPQGEKDDTPKASNVYYVNTRVLDRNFCVIFEYAGPLTIL